MPNHIREISETMRPASLAAAMFLCYGQELHFSTCSIWIGLTDLDVEGQFRWSSTGHLITYENWKNNKPTGHNDDPPGNKDCVKYKTNGEWEDTDCHQEKHFFCQTISASTQFAVNSLFHSPPCRSKRIHFSYPCIISTKVNGTNVTT